MDCENKEIDQISRDQASDDDISDLSENEKNVFREDASFK